MNPFAPFIRRLEATNRAHAIMRALGATPPEAAALLRNARRQSAPLARTYGPRLTATQAVNISARLYLAGLCTEGQQTAALRVIVRHIATADTTVEAAARTAVMLAASGRRFTEETGA